jgi:hypothetical protein
MLTITFYRKDIRDSERTLLERSYGFTSSNGKRKNIRTVWLIKQHLPLKNSRTEYSNFNRIEVTPLENGSRQTKTGLTSTQWEELMEDLAKPRSKPPLKKEPPIDYQI